MTKKVLPTDTVVDDLAGSPFFKRRLTSDAGKRPVFTEEVVQAPPQVQGDRLAGSPHNVPERANGRTPAHSNGKRIITRNSFEIYEDQMDLLRKLSYQEKMEGKLGSMSAMVRDAIDSYLKKNISEK